MNTKFKTTAAVLCAACLAAATSAQAAITYVDAVEGPSGNTRRTGDTQADPTNTWLIANTTSTNNDNWSKRTNVEGNGGTIFQALPNGAATDIPELTTTLSLADGTYGIWVFYWDQVTNDTQNWSIATGLTSGSLTTYSSPGEPAITGATTTGVSNAADLTFTSSIQVESTDGNRQLFGVYLGEVSVSGGSDINIYVDMLIDGSSTASRTWYDGVGYELIPEPTVALLGGLGLLALLRRRRN